MQSHMQSCWMKSGRKKLVTYLIAASLCLTAAFGNPGMVTASSLSELEARQQQVQSQLDAVNEKIDDLQGQIDEQQAYQDALSEQISLYQDQIALLDEQISSLEADIDDKQQQVEQLQKEIDRLDSEIADKQVEIDDTYQLFKQRMVALYEAGETSSLAMLLSSSSFGDFVTNIQLMQAVSESDEQLVDKLKSQLEEQQQLQSEQQQAKDDTEAALEQIQLDEQELLIQRQEQENARGELETAYSQSETAQQDLEALKAEYENDRDAKIAEDQQVEAEIQQIYAQLAAQQQAAEEAQQANNNDGSSSSDGSDSSSSSTVTVDTGDLSFRWPLPGYSTITSGFGSRWGSNHTGIDISGGGVYGSPIVAAEAGTVVVAATHWSYGNYVIVDHGGGYTTLYAHMSSIGCSVGDYVTKGQTIGYVGSTGESTGPHLHFEVRINGTAQNPQNYVSP